MNEQKEREDFEEMAGLGTWGDDAYTDFKDGWLARAEIAERDRVDADLALDLLEDIYSRYEDGAQCYENPEDYEGYLGQAVELPCNVENQIVELLNRRRPRNAAMKEGGK